MPNGTSIHSNSFDHHLLLIDSLIVLLFFFVYTSASLNAQIESFLEDNPGGSFQAYRMNQPQHINGPSR